MTNPLHEIEEKIGELSVEALRRGGEPMLAQVEQALGVAIRHSERIAKGTFRFTPVIEREMRDSVARAERMLDVRSRPLVGL